MQKGLYLPAILRSSQTVFTTKNLNLLWESIGTNATNVRVHYYINKGYLISLRKGLYAKDKKYNRLELATKIFTPSYVSFETVLAKAGIIFQVYGQIFVASYLSREIKVDQQTYTYKKINNEILTNPLGVDCSQNVSIATPERAFLDTLYLNKDYHFDNLSPLDWNKVHEILPIYNGNQRMKKMVKMFFDATQKDK